MLQILRYCFLLHCSFDVRDLRNHVSWQITKMSGKPKESLTARIRIVQSRVIVSPLSRFVVGHAHVDYRGVNALGERRRNLNSCRQCSTQERQESKQGSSGRLLRFSNHLIYTRSCFSLRVPHATGLVARENSRSHTHEIPCRFPHHWEGTPLCV